MTRVTASRLDVPCLASFDEVAETGKPATVDERVNAPGGLGRFAIDQPYPQAALLGSARVMGNVVAPVVEPDDWEVLASA